VIPPQGAFYFFLDLRALNMSSVEMCERILDEEGVGLVPGSAFGEQGEGFIRMTIAASDEDVEAGFQENCGVGGENWRLVNGNLSNYNL
jgi:aspartate/methionine/tyrosine aminotransferase